MSEAQAAPPDYGPPIPEAVRRASQRADELAREASEAAGTEPGGDNPVEPGGEVASVVTDPAAPPASPQSEPSAPAPADWEHRYLTLQGKYNNEVPELRGRLSAMEQMFANLNSAPPAAVPSPAPSNGAAQPIPPEDVEAWGEDLINASQRWAEARLANKFTEYDRRLASVETGSRQVAQLTSQQRVEADLDREVAGWRQVNLRPEFHLWLNEMDMLSGRRRQEMLTEAHGAGNSARTIAFFQSYLNEQTAVNPLPGIRPDQTGAPPADRTPLDTLVVPGRGPTSPPAPNAPTARVWTGAQIGQFYRDKQRGLWRGREAEANQIELDILAASREGRVRQ
jgi:hypothetical protein